MKSFKNILVTIVILLVAVSQTPTARAETGEQSKKFGDYTVYYNAFNSAVLSPEVARQYGITRAGNLGVVNIAIRKGEGKTSAPASSIVNGEVANLLSQTNPLQFKKVEETGAIYYLATFRFDNQDTLTFKINFTPDDSKRNFKFSFQNRFFIDK